MDVNGRTIVGKAFLSGDTLRVRFQIIDRDTGDGFLPGTLTLSIYDVTQVCPAVFTVTCPRPTGPPVQSVVVNTQGTDIIGFCDSSGNVEVHIYAPETDVDVPASISANYHQRRMLFSWTWDSPAKRASREIFVKIAPDRQTVAA